MSTNLQNILRFAGLIGLQVLVLNKISLSWLPQPFGFPVFIPYIFPLFMLLLPFQTPVWALLLLGFVTGLTVDVFMNTAGMHAFAMVAVAFARTRLLRTLLPKNIEEYHTLSPGVRSMGWLPYLLYATLLILLHHILFFTVEFWSFRNLDRLLLKILASSLTSLLLIVVYALLFTRQQQRA